MTLTRNENLQHQREMKTPMQEHIEWMQEKLRILVEYKDLNAGTEVDECIQHAESMLENERQVIMDAYDYGFSDAKSNHDHNKRILQRSL